MKLENVQTGDTLIKNGRYRADSNTVKVDRVTKTQIIIGEFRFRKSDGCRVGRTQWNRTYLSIPREGEIDKIREAHFRQRLINAIGEACHINLLREMPLEKLQQLKAILERQCTT